MPTLSMFYGIIIRMHSERGERHNKPHVHCTYGDYEAVVGLDGEVLSGELPPNKLKLVVAWLSLHEDELAANWRLLSEGEGYFKVDPLK
jgi:hypothetical protein